MAERGNDVHRRVLSEIARMDKRMQRWVDSVAEGPESSPPPATLTETSDPYRSDSDDEDDDADAFVKDPTTSGLIQSFNATTVVYKFAASIDSGDDDMGSGQPLFEFQQLRGHGSRNMHICTVILPSGSPIPSVSGGPYPTQSAARRAACLQVCEELYNGGYLDHRLFPRPRPVSVRQQRETYVSPAMLEEISDKEDDDTPLVKQKSSGTRCYPRRKPDFWSNTKGVFHGRLYPTVISTDRVDDPPQPYQPLVILTRLPLPPVETFRIFFAGMPANVYFQQGAPFEADEEELSLLHKYTLRISRTVANKPFICKPEEMVYFFAPLSSSWFTELTKPRGKWDFPNVARHIPWDLVKTAAENWVIGLKRESIESLVEDIQDAVVQDRWVEFTRRYEAIKVRSDLSPLSKPVDSPVRVLILSHHF